MKNLHKKDYRLGEESLNSQGLHMKIIRYGANNDIDVLFDDGYISYNKTYQQFKNKGISNPNYANSRCKNRIGETMINNQGLNMKIIAYRRNDDIDIEFDDGYISYNKTMQSFMKGLIENPNYNNSEIIDMVGKRIGKLLVIKRGEDYIVPKTQKHVVQWVCQCDCGNTTLVTGGRLRQSRNPTKSCGCLQKEKHIELHRKSQEQYDEELHNMNPYIIRIEPYMGTNQKN